MPISFATSLELDLLYARWSGVVRFDDFASNFEAYLNDLHYRPGRRELIDHSGLTNLDISFDMMRALLRTVNEQAPSIVVETHTVIYSPNDTVYGVGRMYQSLADLAEGIQVEIFQDEVQALAALELGQYSSIEAVLEQNEFQPSQRRDNSSSGAGAA